MTHATDGYGRALARVHDSGFGFHARWAADRLVAALRTAGHRDGLVVDLGCGTGILSERVARAGYEVLGIDRSPAMLELARERLPEGRFVEASFVDAAIPPCVAVAAAGEVLGYAFDSRADGAALRELFARVRASLAPRGVFLFDLAGPGRGPTSAPARRLYEQAEWTMVFETAEDRASRTLTRRLVVFIREGDLFRRAEEVHLLRLHDPGDVERDLRATGFRVRRLRRYGERPFPRGLTGFAAT